MHIPWTELELFLSVAESRSFSRAAKQLGIEQPTVSRRFLALEARVGTRLCERSVSGITLTAAGERLLPYAQHMAEWANGAASVAAGEGRPEGIVRIAAPPGIAFDFCAPFAARVNKRHPGIRLEVLASVDYLNLSRNEADLALRGEPARAKDLETLFETSVDAAAFVSPAYRKRLPKKVGPGDVAWIAWSTAYDNVVPNPQLRAMIPDFQPSFTSDNYLVQLAACTAGLGAMILSKRFRQMSPVKDLMELPFSLGPRAQSTMALVCAKRMAAIPRVAAVVALLREALS
jgi:DNA-binding transcriptional LysR family regulator